MGGSKVSPGPGAYSIKGHIESSMGNGITMISRKNDLTLTSRAQTPGPGTYNPEKQQYKVPPAYRIGSASRSKFEGTEVFIN